MKRKILIVIISLTVGAALGYYALPSKIVEKEVIKIVEKKVKDTTEKENKNKIKIITEVIMPDGTIKREIKEIDKGIITIDASEIIDKDTTKDKEKIVEHKKNNLMVYASIGTRIGKIDKPTYGIGVQKRLFGPIWLGAYATEHKDVALTLGLSF